jgi:hypothetical protein
MYCSFGAFHGRLLAIGGPVNYLQTPEVKLQKATQQAAFLW